jgi:two-component system CitB family sensor kinase
VSVVETAASVTVVVSDNGPGLPDGAISQIFTNGYTTKRGSLLRHAGLGLSLVDKSVAKLNGSISVSEGPGATFTVVLPMAESDAPIGAA